jgi:8-oxo-dGTP diphosphatase
MLARIPVVSAILANSRGEVLMQLRDNRSGLLFPGYWTLPGGMVEQGESPDEAIRRELMEEMELSLPLAYWLAYNTRRGRLNLIRVRQHLYTGRLDTPAEEITLHEGQALRYVSAGEMDALPLAFGFLPILRNYFSTYQKHAEWSKHD